MNHPPPQSNRGFECRAVQCVPRAECCWPNCACSAVAEIVRKDAEIARLRREKAELVNACELFTKGAHDARDALNALGIACPASIALAAEKARAALRSATGKGEPT